MSGETEEQVSGWTVDTLRAHMAALMAEKDLRDQQRFDAQQLALRDALTAQEKAVNAALTAAEQAVQKAEGAAEKRFDAVNEFRGQLADQARDFQPRKESQVLFDSLGEKISDLSKRLTDVTLSVERINANNLGASGERNEGRNHANTDRANIALGVTLILFVITIVGFVIALVNGA